MSDCKTCDGSGFVPFPEGVDMGLPTPTVKSCPDCKQQLNLSIRQFQWAVHELAYEKGFWTQQRKSPYEKLALIHSEVSEALEIFKKGFDPKRHWIDAAGKPEGLGAELADVIIRALDLASYYGIDMQAQLVRKHEHNKTRPYLNGSEGFMKDDER